MNRNFLHLNKDNKEITAPGDNSSADISALASCTTETAVKFLVYKALNGSEPKYFMDLLVHCEPLRSSCTALHAIPKIMTKRGEAAIQFEAPKAWNKLRENLGMASLLQLFKSGLRTLMLARAF